MRLVQRNERAPPVQRPPDKKKAIIVEAVSLSSSLTCLRQRSEVTQSDDSHMTHCGAITMAMEPRYPFESPKSRTVIIGMTSYSELRG